MELAKVFNIGLREVSLCKVPRDFVSFRDSGIFQISMLENCSTFRVREEELHCCDFGKQFRLSRWWNGTFKLSNAAVEIDQMIFERRVPVFFTVQNDVKKLLAQYKPLPTIVKIAKGADFIAVIFYNYKALYQVVKCRVRMYVPINILREIRAAQLQKVIYAALRRIRSNELKSVCFFNFLNFAERIGEFLFVDQHKKQPLSGLNC